MLSRRRFLQTTGASALAAKLFTPADANAAPEGAPNVLFMLVDNLGYGELGAYGGGATRGAATPRIDRLASEGLRLTNMNMEAQCTPSRSSIMTARYAISLGHPFGAVWRNQASRNRPCQLELQLFRWRPAGRRCIRTR